MFSGKIIEPECLAGIPKITISDRIQQKRRVGFVGFATASAADAQGIRIRNSSTDEGVLLSGHISNVSSISQFSSMGWPGGTSGVSRRTGRTKFSIAKELSSSNSISDKPSGEEPIIKSSCIELAAGQVPSS